MTIARYPLMAVLLLACGGGSKQAADTTTPSEEAGGDGEERSAIADPTIVPPDTADEIQRRFDRKRGSVSRCLSMAIDSKELPKQSRGRITLNVVVMASGEASEVKVVNATLESKQLTDCVIAKVKEIEFPRVPKPYPTSYTYSFEAM